MSTRTRQWLGGARQFGENACPVTAASAQRRAEAALMHARRACDRRLDGVEREFSRLCVIEYAQQFITGRLFG